MALKSLLASWLAAIFAVPASLLAAAAGQGLGTLVVGGSWIGVCVCWNREVWALVNQPVLNFAASISSTGYWLGPWIVPLAFAIAVMPLSLRLKALTWQLIVVQTAWVALVVGASWQVFLEPKQGHLARWLGFRGLPNELRWLAMAVAVAAAVPVVLRLLALARIARYHLSRSRRLGLVLLHLFPIPVAWAAVATFLAQEVPVEACIAAALPLVTAMMVAWLGYPAPPTHAVTQVAIRACVPLVIAAALAWAAFYAAGRPLPPNHAAAVQWSHESATNNIRDWMEPRLAPWLTGDQESANRPPDPG
jgi:hypothetical protein